MLMLVRRCCLTTKLNVLSVIKMTNTLFLVLCKITQLLFLKLLSTHSSENKKKYYTMKFKDLLTTSPIKLLSSYLLTIIQQRSMEKFVVEIIHQKCLSAGWRCGQNKSNDVIDKIIDDSDIAHERIEDPELEPLINDSPQSITIPASAK